MEVKGWLKDPEDKRDYSIRRLPIAAITLPDEYAVDKETIIYNQGSMPACVGYSCAGVKTDQEFKETGIRHTFDGLWLYQRCKELDGNPNMEGTYCRIALQVMQYSMKLLDAPQADTNWKIINYYRITSDETDDYIKNVIYQYGSLECGSDWFNSWLDVWEVFPAPDYKAGGHAYRITGWTPEGWIVANSWGTENWGIGGKAVMPYDYFRKYVLRDGDVWKVVDYNIPFPEPPEPAPAPEPEPEPPEPEPALTWWQQLILFLREFFGI